MSVIEVDFPGNIASVASVADLRALPSANFDNADLYVVQSTGLFTWSPSSLQADDGSQVIKPNDLTSLQAGRFLFGTQGPAGPAAATYATLAAFKAASILNKAQSLQDPTLAFGQFNWETANAPYTADNVNIIKADSTALSVGAWVRQRAQQVQYAGALGTESVDAALAVSRPGMLKQLGQSIDKLQGGTTITIACYGDSLTYGQDTSVNGQSGTLPFNGSSVTRSYYPYPETLADALALNQYGVTTTVINRGYPGDTAAMGYSRWSAASATDIAILMFGTNDGKTRTVPIATFKADVQRWIERLVGQNTTVVLMTPPPVNDAQTEANLGAYRNVIRQLATEYRLLCIDTAEMLSSVTNIWSEASDLVHLSSFAYAEIGWQLSALFNNRDLGAKQIAAGSIWYPHDLVGYGGTLETNTNGRSGQLTKLVAGARCFIAGYFDDDVIPIVHSFNSSGTATVLALQYSGNGTNRGIIAPQLNHTASIDNRQAVAGPILRRGYRTLLVLNNGAQDAYIDAIEFAPLNAGMSTRGMMRASVALSGRHCPATQLTALAGEAWTHIDYSLPLGNPYRLSARLNIVNSAGIGVFRNREGPTFAQDFIVARRNGTSLELVEDIAGSATTTTTTTVFSGTFNGEIEIVLTTADVKVYVDGTLKLTKVTPTITSGFPALIAYSGATDFYCTSASIKGYRKGPY